MPLFPKCLQPDKTFNHSIFTNNNFYDFNKETLRSLIPKDVKHNGLQVLKGIFPVNGYKYLLTCNT